ACAFVSPLLALIGADGGGINFRGPSSIGKTTLLATAASVWGRGDERGFIRTWRGTGNGIEAAATQFSDTFLPLDEIGVASGHEVGARGGPPHHRGHGERTVPIFIDRGAPPPVRHEAWSPLNRQPLKVGGEGVEPARAVVGDDDGLREHAAG